MGIYFDLDLENGKEVEKHHPCYLCDEKRVLFVEYQVPSGAGGYVLYDDARKLFSGKEIAAGTAVHLVCEDCLTHYGSEENVIAEILSRRTETKKSEKEGELKYLQEDIEETQRHIDELIQKLAQLYRARDDLAGE